MTSSPQSHLRPAFLDPRTSVIPSRYRLAGRGSQAVNDCHNFSTAAMAVFRSSVWAEVAYPANEVARSRSGVPLMLPLFQGSLQRHKLHAPVANISRR